MPADTALKDPAETAGYVEKFTNTFKALTQEIGKFIVGHEDIVEKVLISVVAGGHVLLEGVPGLGKTALVNTVAKALNLDFKRIQFTPDLLPADILGTNILLEKNGGKGVCFSERDRYLQIFCWPMK